MDKFFGAFLGKQLLAQIRQAKPTIERVLFNKPATIVFWSDGTKTVAKCNQCVKWRNVDGSYSCEESCSLFEPHVGFAVACAKKAVPNWRDEMHKWAGGEDE